MQWILDLDGVVWLGDQVIEGSSRAIAELKDRGEKVVFITNNSFLTIGDYLAKLGRFGIEADASDIVTSAQAAASLLEAGSTALTCGGPGIAEALAERGVDAHPLRAGEPLPDGRPDALVVGYHPDFGYETLSRGAQVLRCGATFIGTNEDPTYPTPSGLLAGTGALLAAFAAASGRQPLLAGKPHEAIAHLVRERFIAEGRDLIVVGDRPSTDGAFARRLSARFALVHSGVTPASKDPATLEVEPDLTAADLATLVGSG